MAVAVVAVVGIGASVVGGTTPLVAVAVAEQAVVVVAVALTTPVVGADNLPIVIMSI